MYYVDKCKEIWEISTFIILDIDKNKFFFVFPRDFEIATYELINHNYIPLLFIEFISGMHAYMNIVCRHYVYTLAKSNREKIMIYFRLRRLKLIYGVEKSYVILKFIVFRMDDITLIV